MSEKLKLVEKPTTKNAIEFAKLGGGAAITMMGAKAALDGLKAPDNLIVNGGIMGAGVLLGCSSRHPVVIGSAIGLGVLGLFRSMRNVTASAPMQGEGMEGINDTLRMLNPLQGGLGNADGEEFLMLGEVMDEEMMGEDEIAMLGEAEVYETITGADGEVIELLGYTDGLGRAKKGWIKRAAAGASKIAKKGFNAGKNIALKTIQNKTGLPLTNLSNQNACSISGMLGGVTYDEIAMAV